MIDYKCSWCLNVEAYSEAIPRELIRCSKCSSLGQMPIGKDSMPLGPFDDWYTQGPLLESGVYFPPSEQLETYVDSLPEDPKGALSRQIGGGHYKDMPLQPIEYILANELGFCEGNIVKYITRYKAKGGAEDVKKVIHYAQILLENINGDS